MDSANYDQFTFSAEEIADVVPFLSENMEGVESLVVDDEVIGIEVPDTVEMTIADTACLKANPEPFKKTMTSWWTWPPYWTSHNPFTQISLAF